MSKIDKPVNKSKHKLNYM